MCSTTAAIPDRSRAKLESKWGDAAWVALRALSDQFKARGFDGPLSLKEAGFLSFRRDACKSIRIIASVSRCGSDHLGHGLFDVVLIVWSSTIFRNTRESDPWYPVGAGYESWNQGYVACLVARLSHLKWAETAGAHNPAWPMTTEGINTCLNDLDALVMPRLISLRSDDDLVTLLDCVRRYPKPKWVQSDGPGIRNLELLLHALQRNVEGTSRQV